jgi:hypothetical protein
LKEKFIVKSSKEIDESSKRNIGHNHENIEYANQISKEAEYHFYSDERPLFSLFLTMANQLKSGLPEKSNIFEIVSEYISKHFKGVSSFYMIADNKMVLLNKGGGGDIERAKRQKVPVWHTTENTEYSLTLIYPFRSVEGYEFFSITHFKTIIEIESQKVQIEYLMSRCEIIMCDYIKNNGNVPK